MCQQDSRDHVWEEILGLPDQGEHNMWLGRAEFIVTSTFTQESVFRVLAQSPGSGVNSLLDLLIAIWRQLCPTGGEVKTLEYL